jgi:hypothetical protein
VTCYAVAGGSGKLGRCATALRNGSRDAQSKMKWRMSGLLALATLAGVVDIGQVEARGNGLAVAELRLYNLEQLNRGMPAGQGGR